MKIPRSASRKRLIAVTVVILLLASCMIAYFVLQNSRNNGVRRDANGTSLERSNIEKNETERIQSDTADAKQSSGSDVPEAPISNPDTGLLKANVVLTNTGTDNNGTADASGFVSNLSEEGGVCTFTFAKGDRTVTKTSTTMVNPTSTTCKTVGFAETELSAGDWQVTLRYVSTRASGTSNSMVLTIK